MLHNENAAIGALKRKPVKKTTLKRSAANQANHGPVKPKTNRPLKKQLPLVSFLKYCALLAALATGLTLRAQTTCQWPNPAGGSWTSAANWTGVGVASGTGSTESWDAEFKGEKHETADKQ
jgi:hypothetical protein